MNNLFSEEKAINPVPVALPVTKAQAVSGLVNLRAIIASDFSRIEEKINRLRAIIRCDVLPWVQENEISYSKLFQILIGTIVDHPPAASKLFIYIRCEKQNNEVLDMSEHDFELFKISIHTNIDTDEHWLQLYQQKIEAIKNSYGMAGSTFNYNVIKNTGCLYSITVAGKLI